MQPVKSHPALLRHRLAFHWRWLLDSPMLFAVWFCVIVAAIVAARITAVARDIRHTQADLRAAFADLVAESAAMGAAAGDPQQPAGPVQRIGNATCTVSAAVDGANQERVVVELPGQKRRAYSFEVLPGGAPPVLGVPFAYAGDQMPADLQRQALAVSPAQLPQVCADLAQLAAASAMTGAIVADDAIALLRLPTGTDRPDYVLGRGAVGEISVRVPDGGVALVDGNLWVDSGSKPVSLALVGDLTILVRGNIYLGRSVSVRGGGRLLLVALAAPGESFRDLDGNCHWSPGDALLGATTAPYRGPQEGSGSIWLGFADVRPETMYLDLGLVAQGELHLAADRVRACGPVLLHHGCTRVPGARGSLTVTADRMPQVDRELVPGFGALGPRRPGLLRRIEDRSLPLYPAGPAR